MTATSQTYLKHLGIVSNYRDYNIFEDALEVMQRFNPPLMAAQFLPVPFLLDYSQRRYIFIHDACSTVLSYKPQYFLTSGLDAYLDLWRERDFDLMNRKVFPGNLSLLRQQPVESQSDLIFSYNYHIRRKDGSFVHLLQRFSYLTDRLSGQVLGTVGTVTDITHYGHDQAIVQCVEKISHRSRRIERQVIWKHSHFLDERFTVLTNREKEILKLIADGLSSKQVAARLRISVNTVHNHRKKMLQKTNTGNTFELLNFAVRQRLI